VIWASNLKVRSKPADLSPPEDQEMQSADRREPYLERKR
jgi:hypothetical protein